MGRQDRVRALTEHIEVEAAFPHVRPVDLGSFDPTEWDSYAVRSGASMRSAHEHLRRLQLRFHWVRSITTYSIHLYPDEMIGHFTILKGFGSNRFYDGLNLLPEHRHLWASAMAAALSEGGDGLYEYGWTWSLEPCREESLKSMDGVTVLASEQIVVQGVDFSKWSNWIAYYKSISENCRRNAKKAEKTFDDLKLIISTGRSAISVAPRLLRLRDAMYRRKGLPFAPLRTLLGYLANILVSPSQSNIAYVMGGGKARAALRIVEFGPLSYYLDGAISSDSDGAGWYLMLNMLRRAYDRSPDGKFLMGYYHENTRDLASGAGLLRSRKSLRVSDWPTSIVSFRWEGR
jgi:hypothetical protein